MEILRIIDPCLDVTTIRTAELCDWDCLIRRGWFCPAECGGWLEIAGQANDILGEAFRASHILHQDCDLSWCTMPNYSKDFSIPAILRGESSQKLTKLQ